MRVLFSILLAAVLCLDAFAAPLPEAQVGNEFCLEARHGKGVKEKKHMMVKSVHKSLFVPIVAKSDTVENVTAFLASAIPLVEAEPKTIQWYGVKFTNFSTPTFAIFDTFRSESGRQTHLNGKVAGALFDNADALLSAAPEIDPGNILASKVVTKPGNNSNSTTEGLGVGLRILFTAKPGQVQATRDFLVGALPLVEAEPLTLDWYALEFPDTNSFAIVDFFAAEEGRDAHLNGKVAAALFASADKLFTGQPDVVKLDVVAATLK
ncbi:Antibiotic biosynthesis monooxygenase [Mycena venus]|uniref:Antibiotic biosynthesis monooxygenase n=1 Tax=Mycena venus TaxID=2733690 RepID=A0A8H6YBN6_9AGAR|nr:Antibiotic biosynthesis monooxygenase [Mycena venus]